MSRTALVTGGTRGIGAAISRHLKEKGYNVIANYRQDHQAASEFCSASNIDVMAWDVSHYDECQKSIEILQKKHGSIDILVNNAGTTKDGFLHKSTPEMWSTVIQANLTSCFNMCHCLIPQMRHQQFGRIVNVSSVNGQKGQAGQVNYSAAKAGLIGLTKALALESASRGITVNAIAPGYTDTDMLSSLSENILDAIIAQIPMGRLGKPSEIAHAVSFLVSDEASFLTGSVLSINGGQYT